MLLFPEQQGFNQNILIKLIIRKSKEAARKSPVEGRKPFRRM
jgi:hypothetical protein